MSKVTKRELRQRCIDNETAIARLESILKENGIERQPQLKQLDQSVFDGLDEKWRWAAVDDDGRSYAFMRKPEIDETDPCFIDGDTTRCKWVGEGYDASNWQNSLIERDAAKELTGSDLCRAMLKRGDKIVTCAVKNYEDELDSYDAIIAVSSNGKYYESTSNLWSFAVPINNQGEPLTQAEAGL